ncbi:Crp/Fnr family transcriptional regulator [Ruminococcus sp.]|uniref:Crp/Fnr family transcriptional regulator n=1 Tax=Ruminococcus sp. TaxID=41978 RepID=UPI0025E86D28|nr:Crp/Fnr family transcriptional regulator [Ruminococcus sp.]MBQ8965417.1 Crp/Fnr family transcriptional regulator [Ruminococcus sp.]
MNKLLLENGFSIEPNGSADTCYMAHTHTYSKGEMILRHLRDTMETAIVLEGTVLLINVNSDGQKSILDICREGDAFGGGIFPEQGLGGCYAIAKTKCMISYVDYGRLIHCCGKSCDKHADLIDFLLGTAARRSVAHIDILSRRTIREKLLTVFDYFLDKDKRTEQTLPVSLSELADYLCCDRSAMMREIKRLNDAGIISSRGNKITLKTKLNDVV